MFNRDFRMLDQEARLTQSALLSGLEFLSKINYDKKETVYPALFQLSIGFERLMKMIVVIDHKVENGLKNPTDKQLKDYGHNILKTYDVCREIAAKDSGVASWASPGSAGSDLLECLSEFAKGSRYYNLDQLAGTGAAADPLVKWYDVHMRIANDEITHSKQSAINDRAIAHCDRHRLYGWEQDWKGNFRPTVDMVFLNELFRQSRRYCVWAVVQILYPFHDLLRLLSSKAHEIEEQQGITDITVPYMYEYFPFFLCEKRTSIRRTRWIGVY